MLKPPLLVVLIVCRVHVTMSEAFLQYQAAILLTRLASCIMSWAVDRLLYQGYSLAGNALVQAAE